jgi:hypothetical protein
LARLELEGQTLALFERGFRSRNEPSCPCLGFRRLGFINQIVFVNPDLTKEPNPKLDELLATYESRLEGLIGRLLMPYKRPDSRCETTTKDGKPCRALSVNRSNGAVNNIGGSPFSSPNSDWFLTDGLTITP